MVFLTQEAIARGASGYNKRKRDENTQQFLRRLTHLYLEDRNIDDVGDDLSLCRNLVVLYLYDNSLSKVPNLNQNCLLTHLYLQNNNIGKIENLAGLDKLTKLYLGGNVITVVEGLEKLASLQELHVEHQRLPLGEKLLFDPRSLVTMSRTIQVLNVSGNNLDSVGDLAALGRMTQFMASDNHLWDMAELANCLGAWRHLWRLELMGNPLCHKSKYRDRVIIMSGSLDILDGKEINNTARRFIENWHASKEAKRRKRQLQASSGKAEHHMGDGADVPSGQLPPRHASLPTFIMPGLPRKQFQELLARSNSMVQEGQGLQSAAGLLNPSTAKPSTKRMAAASAPVIRPTSIHLHVGEGMTVQDVQHHYPT